MSLQGQLFIAGAWRDAADGRQFEVTNPATGEVIGEVAHAGIADLDEALEAARLGFETWRATPALKRSEIMRKGAANLRARVDEIARTITIEQGKPLAEARMETLGAAENLEWMAEEARRTYGRLIPARMAGVRQAVVREPVGVVAAFTPWNFPLNQIIRKVAGALAAGCSIIVKGPEETPFSPILMFRALEDAGVPKGVLQLVYGTPAEISEHLVPHPVVKKISFTGSVPVGKYLAALAGQHMKRATMELGGHAPVIVAADADIDAAADLMVASKRRNAGQVCVSPTRFLVQEEVHDRFLDRFTAGMAATRVGNGLETGMEMGPVITARRREAVEALIADATDRGAKLRTGGNRIGNVGTFLEPTVLSGMDTSMRAMNEEPFGPLALFMPFRTMDDAFAEANRLPFGLAAYAFARSARTVAEIGERVESGMVSINHLGLALAETPFGGIKDSGYGSEGGTEAIDSYLSPKFVTERAI